MIERHSRYRDVVAVALLIAGTAAVWIGRVIRTATLVSPMAAGEFPAMFRFPLRLVLVLTRRRKAPA